MQRQPGTRLLHVSELLAEAAQQRSDPQFSACVAAALRALPLTSLVRGRDDAGDAGMLAVPQRLCCPVPGMRWRGMGRHLY